MAGHNRNKSLIATELVDPQRRRWQKQEVQIRQASVELETAVVRVPPPFTPAQRLTRLHELGHIKWTPHNWRDTVIRAMNWADSNGFEIDPGIALRISKMLEENRIDYILWSRCGIDDRPAREVLDWDAMPVPNDPLQALEQVLQLAWTVWASRGLGAGVRKAPPKRVPDEATARYFDTCWQVVLTHKHGPAIAAALVAGCITMYQHSIKTTNRLRDQLAAELAVYFTPPSVKQPDEKEEEQEEQERVKEQEQNKDSAEERAEKEATGSDPSGAPIRIEGVIQIHDHTAGPRRRSVRIALRDRPEELGARLAFPHRYMTDRRIFGRKILDQAAIMIDGSGSMYWTDDMMRRAIDLMPAVNIALYSGVHLMPTPTRLTYGRICILAKKGKLAQFTGLDREMSGSNDIDVEAVQYLSRWSGPRFWVSDGLVNGGRFHGQPYPGRASLTRYLHECGKIVYDVNRLMRQHNILRVPDPETLENMLRRRPVTLYRSAVNFSQLDKAPWSLMYTFGGPASMTGTKLERRKLLYPEWMMEEPVRFQL